MYGIKLVQIQNKVTYPENESNSSTSPSFDRRLRAFLCLSSLRCLPYSMRLEHDTIHKLQLWGDPLMAYKYTIYDEAYILGYKYR